MPDLKTAEVFQKLADAIVGLTVHHVLFERNRCVNLLLEEASRCHRNAVSAAQHGKDQDAETLTVCCQMLRQLAETIKAGDLVELQPWPAEAVPAAPAPTPAWPSFDSGPRIGEGGVNG